MGLKFLINIFYNIAMFFLVLSIVWSFNHKRYDLLAAAVFSFALVVVLKIRMIKQIKEMTRKGSEQ